MIALINLNTYIGGGETLFVRFSKFLLKNKVEFCVICASGSYIGEEMYGCKDVCTVKISTHFDYYYLTNHQRKELLRDVIAKLSVDNGVRFVTFCLRDLYLIADLSKQIEKSTVTHLILHDMDYLYATQSLFDKVIYLMSKTRRFSRIPIRNINCELLSCINDSKGLISMTQNMNDKWYKELSLKIPNTRIVPLPSCDTKKRDANSLKNDYTILWIGRIVDFKIPSLLAMIDYIALDKRYSLTIVGNGNLEFIKRYVRQKKIDSHRVTFRGELSPFMLEEVVMNHSIGYAMGTSVIEIAKYGKPVIVALSNPKHLPFKRMICGGLISTTSLGDVGDSLIVKTEKEIETTIESVLRNIECDYVRSSTECFNKVKSEYDMETNFGRYLNFILETEYSSNMKNVEIPVANCLRRFFYAVFK